MHSAAVFLSVPQWDGETGERVGELAVWLEPNATGFFGDSCYNCLNSKAGQEGMGLVYIDLVAALNFMVDYLLILGTNTLTGHPPDYKRTAAAAAIGAVYAGMCVLPSFRFLGNMLWRLVSLILMGIIAFGWNSRAVRRYAVFLLLTMALGGMASGTGSRHFFGLVVCAGLLWLLCRLGLRDGHGAGRLIQAELTWNHRTVSLLALRDTGNMLRDPITGEQVLVCGADVGEELLGLNRRQLSNPVDTVTSGILPGSRLIPYHAVGQPSGMMLALRLNRVKIGDTVTNPMVAFSPQEIGKGEPYRMLTGGTF